MTDAGLSLLGRPARYPAGVRELGDQVYAWFQPNGELGESNAGLVVGSGESLLIDTLWDLPLTRRMLDGFAPHTAPAPIGRLVNTHGDPDHCWGNQLLAGVEIIATGASAEDMRGEDPRRLRALQAAGRLDLRRLPFSLPALEATSLPEAITRGTQKLRGLARYARLLAPYDFSGIEVTPPTTTFDGTLELDVGGRRVELIELGPAHAPGDLIVHVPDAGIVFAGDLLFAGVTPIMWVGTVENWLTALERIIELGPHVVVPGHGPVSDLDGVHALRGYWQFVAPAVRERLAGGASPYQAAGEIVRSPEFARQEFSRWDDSERIAVNAETIARNDRGERGRVSDLERLRLLAQMGELAAGAG